MEPDREKIKTVLIMSALPISYATAGMQNRHIPHICNRLKMQSPPLSAALWLSHRN